MYSDHSGRPSGESWRPYFGEGRLPPFSAQISPCPVPSPSPPSNLPPSPSIPSIPLLFPGIKGQLSSVRLVLASCEEKPTYIADVSHAPLVLPEAPGHVDIGGSRGHGRVRAPGARQAGAHHPCQDGAGCPGQAAHPLASLTVTSLTCEWRSHPTTDRHPGSSLTHRSEASHDTCAARW